MLQSVRADGPSCSLAVKILSFNCNVKYSSCCLDVFIIVIAQCSTRKPPTGNCSYRLGNCARGRPILRLLDLKGHTILSLSMELDSISNSTPQINNMIHDNAIATFSVPFLSFYFMQFWQTRQPGYSSNLVGQYI